MHNKPIQKPETKPLVAVLRQGETQNQQRKVKTTGRKRESKYEKRIQQSLHVMPLTTGGTQAVRVANDVTNHTGKVDACTTGRARMSRGCEHKDCLAPTIQDGPRVNAQNVVATRWNGKDGKWQLMKGVTMSQNSMDGLP